MRPGLFLTPLIRRVLWGAAALACSAAQAAADHRVALVVGNGDYAQGQRLANPLNDAADMCAALKQLGYQTLCLTNVESKPVFEQRLQEFTARLKPHSKGLFFYAGHAVQVGGDSYLVPTQANVRTQAELTRELVPVQQVLDQLKAVGNAFNMVVLDACRNDPFLAPPAAPVVATATPRGRGVSASGKPLVGPLPPAGPRLAYGLGAIQDAPVGSIVLYATASKEAAYDGDGRNGPLTKHLLAHIREPGISVEDMIKRVTSGVQSDTQRAYGRRQTPFVYSSFTGEFCFAGCADKIDAQDVERLRQQAKPKPQVFMPPSL